MLWHSARPDEHVTHKHKCTPTHPQQIQYTFFAAKNRQTHTHTLTQITGTPPYSPYTTLLPATTRTLCHHGGTSALTTPEQAYTRFNWLAINVFVYFRSAPVQLRGDHACAAPLLLSSRLGVCDANGAEALQLAGLAWSRRKMWLWRLCACAPVRKCGAACRVASLALCVFECVCVVFIVSII